MNTLDGYVGFVYLTKNMRTGKKYIGQKLFFKHINHVFYESDWKTYFGSSKDLQKDIKIFGVSCFRRKILCRCKTYAELDLLESSLQRKYNVLVGTDWYNRNIQGMHFRAQRGWKHSNTSREKMKAVALKRKIDGVKIYRNSSRRAVQNGTHNFLGGTIQRKTALRRAKAHTLPAQLNPLVGVENPNCKGVYLFKHPILGEHLSHARGIYLKFKEYKFDCSLLSKLATGTYTPSKGSYRGWTVTVK